MLSVVFLLLVLD